MTDWLSIFEESDPSPGASEDEIANFIATIGQPLTMAEIIEVNRSQKNPFPASDPLHAAYRPFDPSIWVMPQRPLSTQYLEFLRWSNGGWCRNGEREFGFFLTFDPRGGVRAMMLAYQLPEYMPEALPFAFNGAGTFYLFDMRKNAIHGEYPVVCSNVGNLGWRPDEHHLVAESFELACRGTGDVDELRWRTG